MRTIGSILAGGLIIAGVLAETAAADAAERRQAVQPNAVACRPIRTAAQLQAMRGDLASSYCLAADIDLAPIRNFIPVGDAAKPFTGSFFGNGHVIRNLTIDNSVRADIGLFGVFAGATLRDLSLVNVDIRTTKAGANGGGLAGEMLGTDPNDFTVRNVSVTGVVRCGGMVRACGGLAGTLVDYTVVNAGSAVDVNGAVAAGGLAGINAAIINDSFATGDVACASACSVGGLVGLSGRPIMRSFATGAVSAKDDAAAGGLVGEISSQVTQSFASGTVRAGEQSSAGGLIGIAVADVEESFSVGFVTGGSNSLLGGLIGGGGNGASATNSYWDTDTSLRMASFSGTGLTTAQLRAMLPSGFDPGLWSINRKLSYPFINNGVADFNAPLATLVLFNSPAAFAPISQFDGGQYGVAPRHADGAALAAVYTMIARSFGPLDGIRQFRGLKIDRYFWDDARQTATFAGPATSFTRRGAFTPLAAKARLTGPNVIGQLNAQRLLILRGSYTKANGAAATHWMLATLYTRDAANGVAAIIANDPWTGWQVEIDPVTKKVLSPANFPLKNFTVDAFQAVALVPLASDRTETPRPR